MHLLPPDLADEAYRQRVLQSLRIVDTPPDPELDNLVELAAKFFKADCALVSLVDADRQWFKARFGLETIETPRAHAFCAHAIADDDVFVVRDALADLRFRHNPLVTGPLNVRFYAGAPLVFRGAAVGTLCVIDRQARADFDMGERRNLQQFAQIAEELIEARVDRLIG
mgnify:CR=1 FL=1